MRDYSIFLVGYKTTVTPKINILKCLFSELPLFYILLKYSVVPVIPSRPTYLLRPHKTGTKSNWNEN
jgi:hypothetical protein